MTDRLDQIAQQQAANTEAIAQTNAALNVLIAEFIRPNAQQARANFERHAQAAEGLRSQLKAAS